MNMEVQVSVSGLCELDQEIDTLMQKSAELNEAINGFRLRLHQLGLEISQAGVSEDD